MVVNMKYDIFTDNKYHTIMKVWRNIVLDVKQYLSLYHMPLESQKMETRNIISCVVGVLRKNKENTTRQKRVKKTYKKQFYTITQKTSLNTMQEQQYIMRSSQEKYSNQINVLSVNTKKDLMLITVIIRSLWILFGYVDNVTQIFIKKCSIITTNETLPRSRFVSIKEQ